MLNGSIKLVALRAASASRGASIVAILSSLPESVRVQFFKELRLLSEQDRTKVLKELSRRLK